MKPTVIYTMNNTLHTLIYLNLQCILTKKNYIMEIIIPFFFFFIIIIHNYLQQNLKNINFKNQIENGYNNWKN